MGTASLIYRRYHSVALSQAGDVYTWGMNYLGQLGLLDTIQRLVPTKVKKSQPGQLFIAFIAAGMFKFKPLHCDVEQVTFLVLFEFDHLYECRCLSHTHDR